MREGRLKEVTKEHPHDISVVLHDLVEKGLLVNEGPGRSTFSCRLGAPGICSKSSSEHLPESFGHLIASSEHLDALREIARPVGSVRKAPKKVVEATILRLCEGRCLILDDLGYTVKPNKIIRQVRHLLRSSFRRRWYSS